MRTYVGSIDPTTSVASVSITDNPDPVPAGDIVAFLDELAEVATTTHLGRPHPEPERRIRVLQHKRRLLDAIRASEHPAAARPLPHTPIHSPDGFAWGYRGNGPADLARAILHRELAETVPRSVYLRFRDDVIAQLPAGRFELPATAVWDWVRANRALVDHHVFGAGTTPGPGPAPPPLPPTPRSSGLSL